MIYPSIKQIHSLFRVFLFFCHFLPNGCRPSSNSKQHLPFAFIFDNRSRSTASAPVQAETCIMHKKRLLFSTFCRSGNSPTFYRTFIIYLIIQTQNSSFSCAASSKKREVGRSKQNPADTCQSSSLFLDFCRKALTGNRVPCRKR